MKLLSITTGFNIPGFKNKKQIIFKGGRPLIVTDSKKAKKMNQIVKQLRLSSGLAIEEKEISIILQRLFLIASSSLATSKMIQYKRLAVYLLRGSRLKKAKKA